MVRLLTLFLASVIVSGCASAPPSSSESEVSSELVEQHQQQLENIARWHTRGRIAFFDHARENRDSASYSWHHHYQPVQSDFRLYHSLRGTLARVAVTEDEATLTDDNGQTHEADSVDSLLLTHTGFRVPFRLLLDAMTGRTPDEGALRQRYYANGTVASYRTEIIGAGYLPTIWEVSLERYSEQLLNEQSVMLPERITLTHDEYEIRIQVSQWELNQ